MHSIRSFVVYLTVGCLYPTPSAFASIIYEGGTVIAFDESTESIKVLEDTSVVIEGNTITQLAKSSDLTSIPSNATRVDAAGKIICPGFIDVYVCHTKTMDIITNTIIMFSTAIIISGKPHLEASPPILLCLHMSNAMASSVKRCNTSRPKTFISGTL